MLVLTPNAIDSHWVNKEVNAAIHRRDQGFLRGVFPILAAPCVPGSIPPLWDILHRFDATADYTRTLADLGSRLGLTIAPTSAGAPAGNPSPAAPQPRPARAPAPAQRAAPSAAPGILPAHLAQLGYAGWRSGDVEYIVPPLCDVPVGEFLMGSEQDTAASVDEWLQHRITLPAFQIARFPVTVAEYACFVRVGGSEPQRTKGVSKVMDWQTQLGKLDHPVVLVSWREAAAYAAWLAQLTDQPWRLPSEAEWEKAACWDPAQRRSRIYPWGDAFDKACCNTEESGIGTTTPVGTYPNGASPCGAQDLAGNVLEWTSSLYEPYPYHPDDAEGRAGSTKNRVLRGGFWGSGSGFARGACRDHLGPVSFSNDVGFRLVLPDAEARFQAIERRGAAGADAHMHVSRTDAAGQLG